MKVYVTHEQINNVKQNLLERARTMYIIREKYIEDMKHIVDTSPELSVSSYRTDKLLGLPEEVNESELTLIRSHLNDFSDVISCTRKFDYDLKSLTKESENLKVQIKKLEEFDVNSISLPTDRTEQIKKNGMKKSNVAAFVRNLKKRLRSKLGDQSVIANVFSLSFITTEGFKKQIGFYKQQDLDNTKLDNMVNTAYAENHLSIQVIVSFKRDKSYKSFTDYYYGRFSHDEVSMDIKNFVIWETDSEEALALYEFNKI